MWGGVGRCGDVREGVARGKKLNFEKKLHFFEFFLEILVKIVRFGTYLYMKVCVCFFVLSSWFLICDRRLSLKKSMEAL